MSELSDDYHASFYPGIHVSGNARAIIGNVYGAETWLFPDRERKQRKTSLLNSLQDEAKKTGEYLTVVSSELSVLLLKDFEDVKSSLYGFHKVESKLQKYAKQINVGRTIFQHTLLTLLSPHAGHERAQAMLGDHKHSMWQDGEFTRYLQGFFGTHVEAVHNVLELISIDLDAIASFSQKCFELKDDGTETNALSAFKRMRSKWRAAINCMLDDDNVNEHLQSLRRNTEDFRTLLQQCTPQTESANVSNPSEQTKLRISRYRRVQEAANNLYHAFGLACTKHTKHQGHLKLLADCAKPSQVQFTLLLEQTGLLTSSSVLTKGLPPLRLTIESQVTGTVTDVQNSASGILNTLASCRKRGQDAETDRAVDSKPSRRKITSRPKKTVGFVDSLSIPLLARKASTQDFPNFCSNSNFCTHVKNLLSQGCCNNTPLGYLDSHGCSKHLIYLSSRTQTVSLSSETRERIATFRELYGGVNRQLSRTEKIALAKQLAVAVLQYQATPWLDEAWKSDNILIESNSSKSAVVPFDVRSSTTFDPYLQVSIQNPTEQRDTTLESCSRTLIRNWTLFSLGLMLLELAYKLPIRDMQKPPDVDPSGNQNNTDYFTANRLQQNVAIEMGLDYSEIVRKCLQCDFGHGSDLGAAKLQEGFYEDVIQKLEDLESKFRALGL